MSTPSPAIQIHTHGKSLMDLFTRLPDGTTFEDLRDDPTALKSLTFESSFQQLGLSHSWNLPSDFTYRITIPIEQFMQLFLSESKAKIQISFPSEDGSTRFLVSGHSLQTVVLAVPKSSYQRVSQKNVRAEKDSPFSLFPLNYPFPMEMITSDVRNKLFQSAPTQPSATSQTSPERLTPAHKIYDRIAHDPTVEEDLFTVGYLDRHTGIKEVAFKNYITLENEKFYNTSVPFHRVRYFKYKDHIVWDREARVNLLDGNKFLEI